MKETIYVNTRHVSCEGESQVVGHPLVYLEIKEEKNEITCPYCSKTFIFKEN